MPCTLCSKFSVGPLKNLNITQVKCYTGYALKLQCEHKESSCENCKCNSSVYLHVSDHYLPIISTFIFANSNSGCTCSTYILWPSLLPPTGLMNTRSLLGRLKPEGEDKILVTHFHSQECHSGSYQWPANSAAPHGIFSLPFSVILPKRRYFFIHLIVQFGLHATIPRTKLHHRNQKQSFSPSICASLFSWHYRCKTTGS